MLNYEFPPIGGGASTANYYLLREFANRDDVVIDLVTSSPGGYKEETFAENVSIFRVDIGKDEMHHWTQLEVLRYSLKAYLQSLTLMEKHSYELIHAWFGIPSGLIARVLRLPYLVALRGSDVPRFNDRFPIQYRLLSPLIKLIWQDAEAVIANSEGLRQLARDTLSTEIGVVPNGVDADEFEPTYTKHEPLRVLCVARLVRRKGVRYLIDAVAELDVDVTIVGEGKREEKLKARVRERGVSDRVSFAGPVAHDEIPAYYERSDLFVLPSFNEGMSNAVLEAMAAGLPVITTDTGGTEELLNGNGLVVPKGDADALRVAIASYADEPERIRRSGKRSRALAEDMSWEEVAKMYLDIYTDIC